MQQTTNIRRHRKRLFVGLISITCFLLCATLLVLFMIPYVGLENIHPIAKWILAAIILGVGAVICVAYWGLFLNILLKRPLPGARRFRGLTVKLFLPLMVLVGRLFGVEKKDILLSFITVNNELVNAEAGQYPPDRVLMLMPHCIQSSRCPLRLTYDINNCKRCGECPIAGLLELHDRYGVHLAIATGGTIARRIVVNLRPKLIIAVACQRDLASGIQDTYPLPVYGILNDRPHGPCLDTTVTLDLVEEAIERFLDPTALKTARGTTISTGEAVND